jgi:hypothetical protein
MVRSSTRENIGVFVAVLIALAFATMTDRIGMPHKWHVAILVTIAPFAVVVLSYRLRWSRWSFWMSLTLCLTVHIVAIWVFFQYVLINVRNLGMLLWFPVVFVEMFVLLVAVKRVEEKLTGKREKVKLS